MFVPQSSLCRQIKNRSIRIQVQCWVKLDKCVYWRWRSTKTIYDFVRFKNNSAVRFGLNSLRSVDDRFLAIQAAVLKEICTSPLPDQLNKLLVIRARELKCEPFEYDCLERSTLSKPKANKQTFVNQDNRVNVLPIKTDWLLSRHLTCWRLVSSASLCIFSWARIFILSSTNAKRFISRSKKFSIATAWKNEKVKK